MDSGDMAVKLAKAHWTGEAEVAWERAAEDREYRRGRDEAWDARMDEPRVLYDDAAGREW